MAAGSIRIVLTALIFLTLLVHRPADASSAPSQAGQLGDMPAMSWPVSTLPALNSPPGPVPAVEPLATPQFRRYGTAEGLPSSTVYTVAQDHNGFMWFGVGVDVVRYDGVNFKVFSNKSGDPSSLPESTIYNLLVDRDNQLWVCGLEGGLSRYDPATDGFVQWHHDAADPASLSSEKVWAAVQTPDGRLWVATDAGLERMLADGRHFEHVRNPLSAKGAKGFGNVRALMVEPDGRLWIGSTQGIFVREVDGRVRQVPIDPRLTSFKVWRIQGSGDDVRIAVTGGLLRVAPDGVARLYAPEQIPSIDVYSSTRDQSGQLWITTHNGLYLDDGGTVIHQISGQPLLLGSLPAQLVWQSLCDREGGLWFVTADGGIAYLAPGWNQFTRFTHIPDDPDSLRGNAASSVLASADGKLWVGGHGLVDKLDPSTGKVQHVVDGVQGDVNDMALDGQKRLWIASTTHLYRYADDKLVEVDLKPAHATHLRRVMQGVDGNMYLVSLRDGLFRIDPDTLAIDPVSVAPTDDTGFMENRLAPDDVFDLYAHNDHLMHWNRTLGKLEPVRGMTGGGKIFSLETTADGFWAAREKSIEHYRLQGDLATLDRSVPISGNWPPMVLIALHVDRAGGIWFFCQNGMWRFDPHSGKLQTFGLRNGLVNGEVRGDSPTVLSDGTFYVASLGGVFGFQPERSPVAAQASAVVIADASVIHQDALQRLPLDGGDIGLAWSDRQLQIDARLASYVDPSANHYRFRLRGLDSSWVETGSHGEREFTGLRAGEYLLDVQAAGADSQWRSLAKPLRIHVQAPPWDRWWAWATYALLVVVVAVLVLRSWRRRLAQRHRMQLIEQQRQLAEAASAAKTQFLATLSHEIRTPMTGVMGMAELMLTTPLSPLQHDYTKAMQRSGGMLLKLLNDALDLARIEAGRLELEPAPFDPRQLLEDVSQLEQGLAHMKGIRFVLDVADDLPVRVIGDAVRIKQVLLNLANNALKFTERGSVLLRAQRTAVGLIFSVVDTGPGIPEASQGRLFQRFEQEEGPHRSAGSGLGLAICRELVDMMGGSIELESRMGYGSSFHVRLPLSEPAVIPTASAGMVREHRQYRLLLVEDDIIVAAVISGLLEKQGHTISHVPNGLAALAELAHAGFDAVLLDLDLPGVDGFQIARLIRQRERDGDRLPIIAVTARSGSEDEMRAQLAGMDGFLRKPLSGEQLAGALAEVVARAKPMTDEAQ